MSATFQYSEALFAQETGLSRTHIRFLREQHLNENVHWQKTRGEIAFSSSAIKRLWRTLRVRPASFDLARCIIGAQEKNGAESILLGSASHPIPRKMTVFAIPPNPMVVRATDEHGEPQLVWVGRNFNFVRGDEIEVAPHESQQGFWRLLGPLPRDRRRR